MGANAHGHDYSPRADLQRLANPSVQVLHAHLKLRVATAGAQPLEGCPQLSIDLACGDALGLDLNVHHVERLIDAEPGLGERRKESPCVE